MNYKKLNKALYKLRKKKTKTKLSGRNEAPRKQKCLPAQPLEMGRGAPFTGAKAMYTQHAM